MNTTIDALKSRVSLPNFAARLPKIPVASAISGLIVAALILMTPNSWFEAFIIQTGLPDLVAAAAPPLGAKARIVFALIAAVTITVVAWTVLKMIVDGSRRKAAFEDGIDGYQDDYAPAIRRADAHPDAHPRRPLMAGHDLGEPLELVTLAPDDEPAAQDGPTTAGIVAEPESFRDIPEIAETLPTSVYAEAASEAPAGQTGEEDHIHDDPVDSEPAFTIPLRARTSASVARPAAETAEAAPADEPVAAVATVASHADDYRSDIAALIDRLEAGLDRRRTGAAAKTTVDLGNVTPHPGAQPGHRDAELREALAALQSLTAKGA